MTFDDLQQQWKQQDAKLDTLLHLELGHLRATHFDSMTTALDRVRRSIALELLMSAALLLLLGSFLHAHLHDLRYLGPAALLHLSAIALTIACVRQLVAARQVDYAGPVVDAQRRLTALRASRIRTSKWTLLIAPALWTPAMLVALKAFGIDAFDRAWIVANILWSIAFVPLMLWAARRFGERLAGSPILRRLADDLAGRSMNEATAFADRLAQFERQADDIRSGTMSR
jgi:hypothetical protein